MTDLNAVVVAQERVDGEEVKGGEEALRAIGNCLG